MVTIEYDEKYEKYMDRLELIYYDNKYTDDEEENRIGEKILEDLITEDMGEEICRYDIEKEYIEETFLDIDIVGYIAKIKGEYVGFIFFKKNEDCIYLSLVGTTDKELKKGIPLGQILISLMEDYAIKNGIKKILANAVEDALPFYKKNGWYIYEYDKIKETYNIEKQINTGYLQRVIKYISWFF